MSKRKFNVLTAGGKEYWQLIRNQGRSLEHRKFLADQEALAIEQIETCYMNDNDPLEDLENQSDYEFEDQFYEWGRMFDSDPWHPKNEICPACLKEIDDENISLFRCVCY